MKLTFAIEASKPCGTTFRMAMGVTLTPGLMWMVAKLTGLI